MRNGNDISDTIMDIIKVIIIALIGFIVIKGIIQAIG